MRAAGFVASKSSGTRIRGAPRIRPGYVARRYNPLDTKAWVVRVTWEGGEYRENRPDPQAKLAEMAEVLGDAGFTVADRGGELYVTQTM
ncbi:MAG: hypothetical protein NVS3B1_28030 [Marmoricola sp.]